MREFRPGGVKSHWMSILVVTATLAVILATYTHVAETGVGELQPAPGAGTGCLGLYTMPSCHAVPELFATAGVVVLVLVAGIYLSSRISRGRVSRE